MSKPLPRFRWPLPQLRAWMQQVEDPYLEFLQPLERGHHLAVLAVLRHDPHPSARWLREWLHLHIAEALIQGGHFCCAGFHLSELLLSYPGDRELAKLWSRCQVRPTAQTSGAGAQMVESPGRLRIVGDKALGDGEYFRRLLGWKPPPGLLVGVAGPCRLRRLLERSFVWLDGSSDWDQLPGVSLLHIEESLPPLGRRPVSPRPAAGRPLRVGLVWADGQGGGVALSAFSELASLPGLEFHALQKGAAALQASWPPPGMVLHDWGRRLPDWLATAEVLAQLDLLITVDTAIAALARALHCPCWVLGRPPWSWRRGWDDLMGRMLKTFRAGQEFAGAFRK